MGRYILENEYNRNREKERKFFIILPNIFECVQLYSYLYYFKHIDNLLRMCEKIMSFAR